MLQSQRSRRAKRLRNRFATNTVISICTDRSCSWSEKKNSDCFSLPVPYLQPGARMTPPMVPRITHIIIADIEEGYKASPVHRRRRPAFDF